MRSNSQSKARAENLIEALPYIQQFRGKTFVIKYGGSAMEDEQQVDRLLRDIVFLEAVGINPVVVHGGGKVITARMREAGLKAKFVNGLRVTDATTIQIVHESLDQSINPGIVERIRKFGGKAIGLSGKDVFVAKKLGLQTNEEGHTEDIGFVGEAAQVQHREVKAAVKNEIVPVISPIGATVDGTILNINADVAAAALAASLKAEKLIFVSDVLGIMRNPAETDSLIPSVHTKDVLALIKQKVVDGGMIPKVQSAMDALTKGVGKVHLISGTIPHCLLLEIFTDSGIGTEIIR